MSRTSLILGLITLVVVVLVFSVSFPREQIKTAPELNKNCDRIISGFYNPTIYRCEVEPGVMCYTTGDSLYSGIWCHANAG